jgi:5'-nucleotidase/UDP-sugar diphosphatase
LKINGIPVDVEKKYLLALPEFSAGGGDKYPIIPFRKTGFVDADILKEYVQSKKSINIEEFAPTGYLKYD